LLVAHARQRDFAEAARRGNAHRAADHSPVTRVTLRYTGAADTDRLRRLHELESGTEQPGSSPPVGGLALVAEVDGRLRAALPLDGGAPIADPFYRGAELLELLRLRAAQLAR